ncbi:MAG: iron-containing alcohol dehydrogenase family protein [Phenylobacterium sp.]
MLSGQSFVIRPLPTLVFGNDSSLQLAGHVKSLGLTAVLFVTDQSLRRTGLAEPVIDALRKAGIGVEVFDGVEPNPTDRNVEAGAERLRELGSAGVIAFGGGSSMDCGKAIALLARNAETVPALQAGPPANPGAPVIAVPTTAGTGSETNSACVITNSQMGRKTYVMHPSITPAFAVLDPKLTLGLPAYPTATCAFDVLTHAIEALVSLRSTPYSDAVALEAIRSVHANARIVVRDGSNLEARSQMLLASSMAAIAFNVAGLGSAHGTGHALSARLSAAHGQTLATMLPHVMTYNLPVAEAKYAAVSECLDPGRPASGSNAVDAVLKLREEIGLARSIRQLGGTDGLLRTLVEDAVADPVNRSNPRPVDAEALEALYRAAW